MTEQTQMRNPSYRPHLRDRLCLVLVLATSALLPDAQAWVDPCRLIGCRVRA